MARFSGLILPAGLKQPIWGLGEALLAGWCLTSNLRLGDNPTGTRDLTFNPSGSVRWLVGVN